MNYIYILFLIEIFVFFIEMCITGCDYVSPSLFATAMFIAGTFCAICSIDYWNVCISIKTFIIVTLGLLTMCGVECAACKFFANNGCWKDLESVRLEKPIIPSRNVFFVMSFFCIFGALYYAFDIIRISGVRNLSAISLVRFDNELNVSTLGKIFYRVLRQVPFPFLFIIAHNIILCEQPIKKNLKYFIPVLSASLAIFFSGSRMPFLAILLAFFVYLVIFIRYKNGRRAFKISKYLGRITVVVIVFLLLFSQMHTIVKGSKSSNSTIQYVLYYFGSPLQLFDKIVDNPSLAYDEHNLFGAYTFSTFWESLSEYGVVSETFTSSTGDGNFIAVGGSSKSYGNVYTIFAAPYYDFGLGGMLIFVAIFFWIFNYLYYKRIKYCSHIKKGYIALLLYGYLFYYVFEAFFKTPTSTVKFQTIIEGFIMVLIYMYTTGKLKIKFR